MLVILTSNIVFATNISNVVETNLTSDTKELKSGEELVITLKFDNYNGIVKGLNAFKATLEYDEELFEEVVQGDFLTKNNWEELKYNKENKEFVAIKKAGSTRDEEIVQIKLKAKKEIEAKDTVIKIKDIVTSEGKEDLLLPEADLKIALISEGTNISDNPSISKQPDDPSNNGRPSISDSEEPSNNENSSQTENLPGILPYAGYSYITLSVISGIIILILAFLAIKNRKILMEEIKKTNRKMFLSLLIVGVLSATFIGSIYSAAVIFAEKGELNNNEQINYLDVRLLEEHLIKLNLLTDDKLENADMNSDGKITVTDLTLLVQKIEKTRDYEVEISDAEYDNYFIKNTTVTLQFYANVSYGETIKSIKIDKTDYSVEKEENSDMYKFNVEVGDTCRRKRIQNNRSYIIKWKNS